MTAVLLLIIQSASSSAVSDVLSDDSDDPDEEASAGDTTKSHAAADHNAKAAADSQHSAAPSEEWYTEQLRAAGPFKCIHEHKPHSCQQLIKALDDNLSKTVREQCERLGFVTEGLHLEGPGQVRWSVHGELNGVGY